MFKKFGWKDISLVMDRDDVHGLILGETLDVGLQRGNLYPNVIKFYGEQNPDLKALLKSASDYSRGTCPVSSDVFLPAHPAKQKLLTKTFSLLIQNDMGWTKNESQKKTPGQCQASTLMS